MKTIFKETAKVIAALAAIFGAASCQEYTIDSQPELPKQLNTDALESYDIVATSPKAIIFNISSNVPWTVTSDQSWCIPTPGMSSASSLIEEITVNCESNTETSSRTASITIAAEELGTVKVIKVVQGPKGILEVQPVEGEFAVEGGESTFTVTSNSSWRAVSSRQWLTFDIPSSEGTGEIEVVKAVCAPNTNGAVRTTIVTVSNSTESKTFEVTQDGSYLEFKEVAEDALIFASAGQTRTYEVSTDLKDWDVTSSNTDFAQVRKTEEGLVEVSMDFNDIFIDRKAVITLVPKNDVEGLTGNIIEVTQGQNFEQVVKGGSKLAVDPETGAATFESPTSEECRVRTFAKDFQLGRYTWTFSDVQVQEGFWIDANFTASKKPRWDNYLGTPKLSWSAPAFTFKTWAENVSGFHGKEYKYEVTLEEVNAMRTLMLEMKLKDGDNTKITTRLTLNDKVLVDTEQENPFIKYPSDGTQIYFGFFGQNGHTPGKFTMTSFNVERY